MYSFNSKFRFIRGKVEVFLALFLLFNTLSIAQTVYHVNFVEDNSIRAMIQADGVLFHDVRNSTSSFEVPKNNQSHAIFHSSLCITAEDSAGNLYGAASYSQSDFTTGPLKIGLGTSTTSIRSSFNNIWELRAGDVFRHRLSYNDPNYSMPTAIRRWPAHGDTTNGYDFYLAPFEDVNGNGIYEPDSGDYPKIKGSRASYFIYNDETSHTFTGGNSMGLEIHAMVYCEPHPNNALNETIFVDYKVYNRSNRDYYKCSIGSFIDFDLGNPLDDYVQTDVNRSMVFAKNGDNYDDYAFGNNGYGDLLGAIGYIVLKGPTIDNDGIDNSCSSISASYIPNGTGFGDGIIDNERFGVSNCMSINLSNTYSYAGDFQNDQELYNYMRSRWKDNRPQTFGGTGYRASGGMNSRVPYFATSDFYRYSTYGQFATSVWTENNINAWPNDRKVVVSSGEFTFPKGSFQELSYAFVFARGTVPSSVPSSVAELNAAADQITNYYRSVEGVSQCSSLVSVAENHIVNSQIKVYPNPTKGNLHVENNSDSEVLVIEIFDLKGRLVLRKNITVNSKIISLDEGFESGLYFLLALEDGEIRHRQKIILNR